MECTPHIPKGMKPWLVLSRDQTRPMLTQAAIVHVNKRWWLIATDSYSAVAIAVEQMDGVDPDRKIAVPVPVLQRLVAWKDGTEPPCYWTGDDDQRWVTKDSWTRVEYLPFRGRLVDGVSEWDAHVDRILDVFPAQGLFEPAPTPAIKDPVGLNPDFLHNVVKAMSVPRRAPVRVVMTAPHEPVHLTYEHLADKAYARGLLMPVRLEV